MCVCNAAFGLVGYKMWIEEGNNGTFDDYIAQGKLRMQEYRREHPEIAQEEERKSAELDRKYKLWLDAGNKGTLLDYGFSKHEKVDLDDLLATAKENSKQSSEPEPTGEPTDPVMKVKDLIRELQKHDPEKPVVGYTPGEISECRVVRHVEERSQVIDLVPIWKEGQCVGFEDREKIDFIYIW